MFQASWDHIQSGIRRAIERLEAKDRVEKEEARHAETLRAGDGANHIAKWAIVIAHRHRRAGANRFNRADFLAAVSDSPTWR